MSNDVFMSDALIQTNTGDFVLDSTHISNHYYEIENFAKQCSYKGWSKSKTCGALGISKDDRNIILKVYENVFTICGSDDDDIFDRSLA